MDNDNTPSKAAAYALDQIERTRASILECDYLTKQVEEVVKGCGYLSPDGSEPGVKFFDNWYPRAISVAVFGADPEDVIEGLAGPLFRNFGIPWKMETMENFKLLLKMGLGFVNGAPVELVVQVIDPQGCTFKTVTKEVMEMDCTA